MITKLALLLVVFFFCSINHSTAAPAFIDWQNNYERGMELAKRTGKPVIIDFWASWCGPCKQMDRDVWPDARIQALAKKFVCIWVDVDSSKEVPSIHRVKGIPTLIVADPWMNVFFRREGYLAANDLSDMLKDIPGDFSSISEWQDVLERDAKDARALSRIGAFYRNLNLPDLSNAYIKRALNTKSIEADQPAREQLLITLGLNYLKLKKFDDARKAFEQCLKDVPNGTQCDKALLGILTAQVSQGKRADAEKTFEQLKARFPDSAATKQAAQNLAQAKSPAK